MTLALSAYLDVYARQNAGQAERFDLIAGSREGNSSSTYALMNESGAAELAGLAPDVERISPYASVWSPTVELDGRLYAFQGGAYVDNVYFELNGVEATRGSLFTQREAEAKASVLLLSDGAADILFPGMDPLGQTLTLMPDENSGVPAGSPTPFRIVGTFADNSDPLAEQAYVYFPLWSFGDETGGFSTLNVQARAGRGEAAREQVLSAARQVFGQKLSDWDIEAGKDFYIREMGESDLGLNPDLLDPTVVMFALFGVVALLVGSIGIFSIGVVDALERTHDIGVQRALGATRGRVVRDLTLESAGLSGLGGLLGVGLAALLIPLLDRQVGSSLFWSVDLRWQPTAALLVVGMTLGLGVVLGIFPALRAGRVRPADVLRGT